MTGGFKVSFGEILIYVCKTESQLIVSSGGLRSNFVSTRDNCQDFSELFCTSPFKLSICKNQEDGSQPSHQVPADVG